MELCAMCYKMADNIRTRKQAFRAAVEKAVQEGRQALAKAAQERWEKEGGQEGQEDNYYDDGSDDGRATELSDASLCPSRGRASGLQQQSPRCGVAGGDEG